MAVQIRASHLLNFSEAAAAAGIVVVVVVVIVVVVIVVVIELKLFKECSIRLNWFSVVLNFTTFSCKKCIQNWLNCLAHAVNNLHFNNNAKFTWFLPLDLLIELIDELSFTFKQPILFLILEAIKYLLLPESFMVRLYNEQDNRGDVRLCFKDTYITSPWVRIPVSVQTFLWKKCWPNRS